MSEKPKALDFGSPIECPYCGDQFGMNYQDTVQTSESEGEDCYLCSKCGMDYQIRDIKKYGVNSKCDAKSRKQKRLTQKRRAGNDKSLHLSQRG